MKNKALSGLLLVFLFVAIFSLSFVSAGSIKLLCLERGETIQFSKCNSLMPDRTCETNNGCQYCVEKLSNGIYCPKSLNECNSRGLSCSSIEIGGNEIEINQSSNNTGGNTGTQNNTGSTNNNQNTSNSNNSSTNNNSNSTSNSNNSNTNTNSGSSSSSSSSSSGSSGSGTTTLPSRIVPSSEVKNSTSFTIGNTPKDNENADSEDSDKNNSSILQDFLKNLFSWFNKNATSNDDNNKNQVESNKTSFLDRFFNRNNENKTSEEKPKNNTKITGSSVTQTNTNTTQINPISEDVVVIKKSTLLVMVWFTFTLLEVLVLVGLLWYDKKTNNKIKDAIKGREHTAKGIIEAAKEEKEKSKKDSE
ncbi:MAG: hypothetical protein AABX03_00155 [Nanoarchaeota archaeon]